MLVRTPSGGLPAARWYLHEATCISRMEAPLGGGYSTRLFGRRTRWGTPPHKQTLSKGEITNVSFRSVVYVYVHPSPRYTVTALTKKRVEQNTRLSGRRQRSRDVKNTRVSGSARPARNFALDHKHETCKNTPGCLETRDLWRFLARAVT